MGLIFFILESRHHFKSLLHLGVQIAQNYNYPEVITFILKPLKQAKWKLSKKEKSECVRLKLKWDHTKLSKPYGSTQLRDALGAAVVVLSNKRKGCAVAEFER